MISVNEQLFGDKHMEFINTLNLFVFGHLKEENINIRNRNGFVRYEVKTMYDDFILQFQVVEGSSDTDSIDIVHISNILIPIMLRGKGISKKLITMMLAIADDQNLSLFISGIVNDNWLDGLIKHGGRVDEDGDVYIPFGEWDVRVEPEDFVRIRDLLS